MFRNLAQFKAILVTGAQRSGTRGAAKMIKHDLSCSYTDEKDFGVDSLNGLWNEVTHAVGKNTPTAIQCPALSRYVHHLAAIDPDRVAVVWMMRPLEEVIVSQEKINWKWEPPEHIRYGTDGTVPIKLVKDRFWSTYQKHQIKHSFEVQYRSLEDHVLWVPDAVRDAHRNAHNWTHSTTHKLGARGETKG